MSELRFTDNLPSRDLLENTPNWVHARGEESRGVQDETTIKPQRHQDRIDSETEYTTADVWFANESACLALVHLNPRRSVDTIEIYEDSGSWQMIFFRKSGLWELSPQRNLLSVTFDDAERFPLRYCTRLSYNDRPIVGKILSDGKGAEWDVEAEWG